MSFIAESPPTIKSHRQRQTAQPVPASVSPSPTTQSRSFGGPRSVSTPASGVPRPVKSASSIVSGQKGSVRNLTARFEGASDGRIPQPRPGIGIRSASATASALPRPKTPISRLSDHAKPSLDQRSRLHKSPPQTRLPSESGKVQKKAQPTKIPQISEPQVLHPPPPSPDISATHNPARPRKLFGEIDVSVASSPSPGHGIPKRTSRRGSDGGFSYTNTILSTPPSATLLGSFARGDPPHVRSRSDVSGVPLSQKPLGITSLHSVLPQDWLQDLESKRKQSRVSAPAYPDILRSEEREERNPDTLQQTQTTPSPASFSPLRESFLRPDQRLKASIKEPSPQKSPPLRSSRPRQQVSAVNTRLDDLSSHERPTPVPLRSAFRDESQSTSILHTNPLESVRPLANTSLLQLPTAVYERKARPALSVDPGARHCEQALTPGSITDFEENGTDFEEDTPISATKPEFPVDQRDSIHEDTPAGQLANSPMERHFHEHHHKRAPQGLALQTDTEPARPSPVLIEQPPFQASPTLSQDGDNAGTIDIFLDQTGWDPPLEVAQNANEMKAALSPSSASIMSYTKDDIQYLIPQRTRDELRELNSGRLTVDNHGYNAFHQIIDDYQQTGSLSPQMVEYFQKHLLVSDGPVSKDRFEHLVREQALSRQTSQTSQKQTSDREIPGQTLAPPQDVSPSTLDSSNARQHTSMSVPIFEELGLPKQLALPESAPASTVIGSEDGTTSTTTPMPHRMSAHTVHSVASDHPSLPEIQDTGGGLGLLSSDEPPPGSLLENTRAGTISQSEGSSIASHQAYTRSLDSHQAASGQQEIPETPPTSVSRPQSFRSTGPSSRNASLDQSLTSPADRDRLVQRQRVIQELVDTEFAYHQDMTVLEDIYMGTAGSCADFSAKDIQLLFGNTSDMAKLSRDFADQLRKATRGVYVKSRTGKWALKRKEPDRISSMSTTSGSHADVAHDGPDEETDRKTTIGEAIMRFLPRIEKVYSEYLKNASEANQLLAKIQDKERVKLWLQECHEYAKDLTEAWSLDALIIKPTQRITRYPLLLYELKKSTAENHPDRPNIEAARDGILSLTDRINDLKKRSDLVESAQAVTGKKGGFNKYFGVKAERWRQKIGKSEGFEDMNYNEALSKFSTETHKVQFVLRDFMHQQAMSDAFMRNMIELTQAWEAIVEVKPSLHPEVESKWRRYSMIVRELAAVGYSDYVARVSKSCIQPLKTLLDLYKKPEALTKKRKERLAEYIKYKSAKEHGEKIDKKLAEAGEQFIALNDTLKDELPKLCAKTKIAVEECLVAYSMLNGQWQQLFMNKVSPVLDERDLESAVGAPIDTAMRDLVRYHIADWTPTADIIENLASSNKHLLQGTADFFASTRSARANSQASRTSPGFQTPDAAHRGSTGSVSPSGPAPPMPPRPSAENGHQTRLPTQHHRVRSQSHGPQTTFHPTVAPVSQIPVPQDYQGTFFVGQSPPAQAHEMSSYEAAGVAASHHYAQQQPRPVSSQTYHTARPVQSSANHVTKFSPKVEQRGIFQSALPMSESPNEVRGPQDGWRGSGSSEYEVQFLAASLFDFTIDRTRQEAGYPYLTYVPGEIFDVIGTKGELWLAKNQDDRSNTIGWIWEKHFAKLMAEDMK